MGENEGPNAGSGAETRRRAEMCPICGWRTRVWVDEQGGASWRCKVCDLEAENALLRDSRQRLKDQLDEAVDRSIEARNPGIDMDEVRRLRASPNTRSGGDDEAR